MSYATVGGMAADDTTIEALQARIAALEERADEHDKKFDAFATLVTKLRDASAAIRDGIPDFRPPNRP